ncbi:MAG: 2-amino-4-hydroxy-6-hydroxymethyldihydropteridine diphosphokinase [Bacteroidales bacterium]|nr:2-amino-4-hydroxy-6-hydroxymethyldihydropteridine diphosphokinase [Bacteroidales bacterium]MDD4420069.1 2-amino-4-hydroxy-6-hydroxymethyldihydropteridine diphosphokinase [Bacteroidales bacterium]
MQKLYRVYLLLGSNIGDKKGIIEKADKLLIDKLLPDYLDVTDLSEAVRTSSILETEPWGIFEKQLGETGNVIPIEKFMNQAFMCLTYKEPQEVLDICLETEKELGRKRKEDRLPQDLNKRKYLSRNIDIDILKIFAESNHGEGNTICAELQINTERLTVPHARLKERPFARKLLKEIL